MQLLTLWLVAFVLAITLPAPAIAQTLKPADLVGTWVSVADGGRRDDSLKVSISADYLTLDANGTYKTDAKKNGEGWGSWAVGGGYKTNPDSHGVNGLWSIAGDSLAFGGEPYHVVLKDKRLLLWNWLMWEAGRRDEKCADLVFQRFDSSKPLSLPPPPQITIQLADIVGTWTGTFKTRKWGTVTDTLVIGADHSLRTVHVGPYDTAHERGTWALLPGDVLTGPLGNIDRVRIYLQNGELVRCNSNYAVLKRIAH